MKVVVATHDAALEHDTGPGHPESPMRVTAALEGIRRSGLGMAGVESPRVSLTDLRRVHDPGYVEQIEMVSRSGGGLLDYDTVASPSSYEAALRAAGGVVALIEELGSASDTVGVALTRPPGHHALRSRAMGFCLFNNVAVAAAVLRARGQRVAVLDWDVHHGNGTQAILGDDAAVLYVSIHQGHFYPFEGEPDDIERMAPGTNLNFPLPGGTGGDVVGEIWEGIVVPVVRQFEPDWVLVSAGYDAHHDDPLADLALTSSDFGAMSAALTDLVPPERVVIALEGGYDMDAIEDSMMATLLGFAGEPPNGSPRTSPPASRRAIDRGAEAVSRHWKI